MKKSKSKKRKSKRKKKPTVRRSGEGSGGKIRAAIAALAVLGLVWLLIPKAPSTSPGPEGVFIGTGAGDGAITAADGEPCVLVVRVLWDDGRRAGGAIVRMERVGEGDPGDGGLLARTNEHGVARFQDIVPGDVSVSVLRRGDERDWVSVKSGVPAVVFSPDFPRGVTVVGDVVDEFGQPVSGASIWISEPSDRVNGHVVTSTDDDGRFRVRAVGVDGLHWLGASAPGRASTRLQEFQGEPGDEVSTRFVLGSIGAVVRGDVTDAEGAPVAGAQVLLGYDSPEWASDWRGSPPRWATTGAGGQFRLDSVPLGTLPLHVRAPGFAPYLAVLDVVAGENGRAIRMDPESRVVGRVSDADGKSVPDAIIHSHELGAFSSSEVTSGRGGRFELDGLEAGKVRLVARHPHRGWAETVLYLTRGEKTVWSPVLRPVPRIFGRVVDRDGEPIARRELALWSKSSAMRDIRSTFTDGSGKYSFDDVPDRPHVILVHDIATEPSFPSLTRDAVMPSLEPLDLVVPTAAESMGAVGGRIMDASGEPVPKAEVTFTLTETGFEERTFTDADGRFAMHLPPGAFSLRVTGARQARVDLDGGTVEVGERVDLGDVRLPAPAVVSGSILDVPDALLGSIRIEWLHPDGRDLGRGTLVHRDYTAPPLGPGPVVLRLHGDFVGRIEVQFDVEEGVDHPIDLIPRAAGLRRVQIELPDRDRPTWLSMEVEDRDRRVRWSWAGTPTPTGPTELSISVPPGEYRFHGGTDTGLFIGAKLVVEGLDGEQEPLRVRAR